MLQSPIDGVVTRMSATLGASVDPGATACRDLRSHHALDILLSVTPTEAARVHPGAKTTLSAGQSGVGEPLGVGTVIDVSGTIDSATRSVTVRVQAPTTRRPLRVGETVFGAIAVVYHVGGDRHSRRSARAGGRQSSRCSSSTRTASRTRAR